MGDVKMTAEERVAQRTIETDCQYGDIATIVWPDDAVEIAEAHAKAAVTEERQRIADYLPIIWYPNTELSERVLLLTQDWRRLRHWWPRCVRIGPKQEIVNWFFGPFSFLRRNENVFLENLELDEKFVTDITRHAQNVKETYPV